MAEMTKADRHELRQVIKAQFAVLRSEVAEREGELLIELELDVEERFRTERDRQEAIRDHAAEIMRAASREITDLLAPENLGVSVQRPFEIRMTPFAWPNTEQKRMRELGKAQIAARVRQARLALDRQEADLLRALAVDAIESDAGQRFLGSIPTVGQLVPAPRLAELEAEIKET